MRGAMGVLTRLVARMRASPCPEAAAAFAAAGEDRAATRLATTVRAARGTDRTGLAAWATECPVPGIERAVTLVGAAEAAPPDERADTLDRARDAVLEGARDEAAAAAATLRGPATALYAFGVILPLALVAVLPAASVAGAVASLPLLVVVYDVVLPVALALAGWQLLEDRPTAFPPPTVGRDHPAVPDRPSRAVAGAVAAGILAGSLARVGLPGWTVPLAWFGTTVGTGLTVVAGPYVEVHERVEVVERDLPDACSLVGAAVTNGTSVEQALAVAAEELEGPTAAVLSAAVARQERLGVGVEAAFLGSEGALANLPSSRSRDAARLLGVATVQGRPGGHALDELGDHLGSLRRIDAEARRDLRRITTTLANTAAAFGPLVGGATVAMASAFGDRIAVGAIGLAVGFYVVVLAGVLGALSVGLEQGRAPGPAARRAGLAIVTATGTYLGSFVGAALLT